jgi:hypothetical protein
MSMVRHDDEVARVVRVAITGKDLAPDDGKAIGSAQVAFADSTIKVLLRNTIEMLVILKLIVGREARDSGRNILNAGVESWNSRGKPTTTFIIPLLHDVRGNGIAEPEGYKVRSALLSPMWQRPVVDAHGTQFVERNEWRTSHRS